MASRSAQSPSKGVLYLKQFPKNFLRPYGRVEDAPDEVFNRIKPDSCEWLRRHKVAMSEMAETVSENLKFLENKSSSLISKHGLRHFQSTLKPLSDNLVLLNNKSEGTGSHDNVRKVLKFFVGADEATDSVIDEALEVGAALFVTAAHTTVARTLFRNPEKYANVIEGCDGSDGIFKKARDMKAMKEMLQNACCPSSSSTSKAAKPARRELLKLLMSSGEESDESSGSCEVAEKTNTPSSNNDVAGNVDSAKKDKRSKKREKHFLRRRVILRNLSHVKKKKSRSKEKLEDEIKEN